MRDSETQVAVPEATFLHRWARQAEAQAQGREAAPWEMGGTPRPHPHKRTCGPAGLAQPRHLLSRLPISAPRPPDPAGRPGEHQGGGGGARLHVTRALSRSQGDGRTGASPPAPRSSAAGSPPPSPQGLAPPNPGPWWLGGERTCPGLQPRALGSRGKSGRFFEGGRERAAASRGRWPPPRPAPPARASAPIGRGDPARLPAGCALAPPRLPLKVSCGRAPGVASHGCPRRGAAPGAAVRRGRGGARAPLRPPPGLAGSQAAGRPSHQVPGPGERGSGPVPREGLAQRGPRSHSCSTCGWLAGEG